MVGLVSPLNELVGPSLPAYVDAVLIPFDGHIIHDSLLIPRLGLSFGPGIRNSLRIGYRKAREREGVTTSLVSLIGRASQETSTANARQRVAVAESAT